MDSSWKGYRLLCDGKVGCQRHCLEYPTWLPHFFPFPFFFLEARWVYGLMLAASHLCSSVVLKGEFPYFFPGNWSGHILMSRMMGTAARKVPLLLACLPKVPTFTEMSFAYWHFLLKLFEKCYLHFSFLIQSQFSDPWFIQRQCSKISFWHKQQIMYFFMNETNFLNG